MPVIPNRNIGNKNYINANIGALSNYRIITIKEILKGKEFEMFGSSLKEKVREEICAKNYEDILKNKQNQNS